MVSFANADDWGPELIAWLMLIIGIPGVFFTATIYWLTPKIPSKHDRSFVSQIVFLRIGMALFLVLPAATYFLFLKQAWLPILGFLAAVVLMLFQFRLARRHQHNATNDM